MPRWEDIQRRSLRTGVPGKDLSGTDLSAITGIVVRLQSEYTVNCDGSDDFAVRYGAAGQCGTEFAIAEGKFLQARVNSFALMAE
ncbi:MAG TPA: hypothetical protein VHI13_02285 [Candidatus Kapabacteria bacterium]|nr:hypothetical protein [Candidatus Kapabacteria bacterium]